MKPEGNRPLLSRVADVAIIAVAIASLFVLVRRGSPEGGAAPARTVSGVPLPSWRELLALGPRAGDEDAVVEIVVFTDYQCPGCRQMHEILGNLERKYGHAIAITTVAFPLPQHPLAVPAANAAECAHAQGAFRAMEDALFRNQGQLWETPMKVLGEQAGVRDVPEFVRCASLTDTLDAVKRGLRKAHAIRLQGTPALIVNGLLLNAIPSEADLHSYIDRQLNSGGSK